MNIPQKIVSHRANLFNAICQIASSEVAPEHPGTLLPITSLLPAYHMGNSRKRPRIVGKSVIFGSRSLDLSGAPMTLELYKLFIESKTHRVNKFEIAERVYGIQNPQQKSERFWSATKLNITKLISRSRKQASATLSPDDGGGISWFTYNSLEDAWELYTVRVDTHPEWKN